MCRGHVTGVHKCLDTCKHPGFSCHLSWQAVHMCVVPKQKKLAMPQQYRHFHSINSVPCCWHLDPALCALHAPQISSFLSPTSAGLPSSSGAPEQCKATIMLKHCGPPCAKPSLLVVSGCFNLWHHSTDRHHTGSIKTLHTQHTAPQP